MAEIIELRCRSCGTRYTFESHRVYAAGGIYGMTCGNAIPVRGDGASTFGVIVCGGSLVPIGHDVQATV